MQSFRRFDRATYLLIGLLSISFLLTTLDVRGEQAGVGEVLRDGAQTVFSPLQKAATAVARPVVGFFDAIADLAGLREENDRLRRELAALEAQIQEVDKLQAEVERLQSAAGFEAPGELLTVTARIFADGISDFDRIRYIDRGSDSGVAKGNAVVDAETGGLVGIVDLVGNNSARVRLITDTRFGVGVRNQNTGETGWIEGRGTGPLRLEMPNAEEPVTEGDVLVTSGSRYPPDIVVGTVLVSAESEAGFVLETDVEPRIDLGRLDYVEVINGWSPLDVVTESEQPDSTPERAGDSE